MRTNVAAVRTNSYVTRAPLFEGELLDMTSIRFVIRNYRSRA